MLSGPQAGAAGGDCGRAGPGQLCLPRSLVGRGATAQSLRQMAAPPEGAGWVRGSPVSPLCHWVPQCPGSWPRSACGPAGLTAPTAALCPGGHPGWGPEAAVGRPGPGASGAFARGVCRHREEGRGPRAHPSPRTAACSASCPAPAPRACSARNLNSTTTSSLPPDMTRVSETRGRLAGRWVFTVVTGGFWKPECQRADPPRPHPEVLPWASVSQVRQA